jgi:S1-C subfamily serine protease
MRSIRLFDIRQAAQVFVLLRILACVALLSLVGCGNKLKADLAPDYLGRSTAVERIGIAGAGTAAAVPAFQQAGYRVIDLGTTDDPIASAAHGGIPFVASVDRVGTDGAWWDGFFDFAMRVTETKSKRIVWSATGEYGQAGLFINQTKSTSEAMSAMVADFAKSFPPSSASEVASSEVSPATSSTTVTASGTGFFISPDGLLLTANHVIENAKVIEIVLPNQKRSTAKVLHSQPGIDLAILETDHRQGEYLSIPSALDSKLGEQVFTIGFPATAVLGEDAKYSEGTVSSLTGIKGDASVLQVSVPVQPGNSGGPLINRKGEAIGVVISSAAPGPFLRATGALPQNVNFAVRSDLCKPLLAGRPVPVTSEPSSREAGIERAKAATVQILVRE